MTWLLRSLLLCVVAGWLPLVAVAQDAQPDSSPESLPDTTRHTRKGPELEDLIEEVDRVENGRAVDTVDYWTTGAKLNLQYSMVNLSNWAQGGENSIALNTTGNLFAKYQRDKVSFQTTMDMAFALQRIGPDAVRKNEDRFDWNTTFGYKAAEKLDYAALVNLRSQFAPGFNYPNDSIVVSRFFSPAFVVTSLGMEYKPNKYLRINLSPASGKFTFVTNQLLADQGRFGVKPAVLDADGRVITRGERVRYEFGASLFARFTKDILENVNLDIKLDLFNGYADPKPDNRANIDVNTETTLRLKVNKYISANLFLQVIYDQDIPVPLYEMQGERRVQIGSGPRTQLKHVSGVGFTITFE